MSVPRVVVFVCLVSVLLAAGGWASAGPVVDQIAAAVALPDGAGVVLDAVYVENVIGGYASVRDTWAHSQDLLVSTDAAVQANWTVKVTGQMTTIDGQRVLIASAVQLYVTVDGSPAPPFPACLLAGMAGISLVNIPPMAAQRGVGHSTNTLETTSESSEQFDGSIASAKRVGGTLTLAGKVVTAVFADSNAPAGVFFYIQEPGSSGLPGVYGIKVIPRGGPPVATGQLRRAEPVEAGNIVDISGSVVPSGGSAGAECYVDAVGVKCVGNRATPKPLGLNQRTAIAGACGAQPALYANPAGDAGVGIGIVGTRVRLWGKVLSDTGGSCWIDDGSGLDCNNGSSPTGIHVIFDDTGRTAYETGEVVTLTGILGAEMSGTGSSAKPVPLLRVPDEIVYPSASQVICVDQAHGSDDSNVIGTGWANAAKTIQRGLQRASNGDEIWVAAGTYDGPIDVDKSVAIYGGFVGGPSGETYRNERDWVANPTVLDGTASALSEQPLSVVRIGTASSPVTRIDGFTIQNGASAELDPDDWVFAGGLMCEAGTTVIANNTFLLNTGASGGAIHCRDCTAVIWSNTFGSPDDVDFVYANLTWWVGCAVYFYQCSAGSLIWDNTIQYNEGVIAVCVREGGADVVNNTIRQCPGGFGIEFHDEAGGHIANNNISDCWGGIRCDGSSPDITGNFIEHTEAQVMDGRGAIDLTDSSSLIADNIVRHAFGCGMCIDGSPTVQRNTVFDAGAEGISCSATWSQPCLALIKNNVLIGNSLGGIVCVGYDNLPACAPTIDGNIFDGNSASFGAAILLDGVRRSQSGGNYTWLEIKNNLFLHNHASGADDLGGGAIYAKDSEARIVNNTFVENLVGDGTLTETGWTSVTAKVYGGAVHVAKPGTSTRRITLINNIFYKNRAFTGDSVACTDSGLADVSYSDAWPGDDPPLRRNYTAETGSECTLPPSPLYLEPVFSSGHYWLQPACVLRNQGLYLDYNAIDFGGWPRPGTGGVDIGAYESDPGNYSYDAE